MAELFICPGCMEKQNMEFGICPCCGYDMAKGNLPHQLPCSTILAGRYLVGRVIGEGGFGITYIGYDLKLENKVAVKEFYIRDGVSRTHSLTVVPTSEAFSESFTQGKARFLEEAQLLAKFTDEPGIVRVRDYFAENGTAYIVMEYLAGTDLSHYLSAKGPMSFDRVIELLEPAMLSLDKVHKKGLIHRDISPANLMLLPDGSIKLLDFGTAREQSLMGEKSLSVMLKHGYAPEEQYRTHGKQGPWTDVYAMSASIYRLITAQSPQSAPERMNEDRLAPPSSLGIKLSPAQETALMRGMAVRAEDRIQTMDELLKCLKGQQKPKKLRHKPKLRRLVPAAAAVLIIAAAAMLVVPRLKSAPLTGESEAALEKSEAVAEAEQPKQGQWVLKKEWLCVKETQTAREGSLDEVKRLFLDRGHVYYAISGRQSYYSLFRRQSSSYEYDAYGNEVRILTDSEGVSYSMSYEVIKRYDEQGRPSYYGSVGLNEKGEISYSNESYYEYEYDEQLGKELRCTYNAAGKLTEMLETDVKQDGLLIDCVYNGERKLLYYTETGEYEGGSSWTRYNADGTFRCSGEYEYDAEGRVIRCSNFYPQSGRSLKTPQDTEERELQTMFEYTYDELGRKASGVMTNYYLDTEVVYDISYEYEEKEIYVWE